MSANLKALSLHVCLAIIKKSYLDNYKHIEANAQDLVALKHTLSKDYLCMVSHCDFAFAVWNTLTSPKLQTTNYVEKESANAQALDALKHSLSKEYLSMISHCDSVFAVWNTLTSQVTNNKLCGERI